MSEIKRYDVTENIYEAPRAGAAFTVVMAADHDAEVARLRAALEKHGRHLDGCEGEFGALGLDPCTCGLDAALTEQQK